MKTRDNRVADCENIVVIYEFRSYSILESKDNFMHFIVNHFSDECSNSNEIHTNSIKSF